MMPEYPFGPQQVSELVEADRVVHAQARLRELPLQQLSLLLGLPFVIHDRFEQMPR